MSKLREKKLPTYRNALLRLMANAGMWSKPLQNPSRPRDTGKKEPEQETFRRRFMEIGVGVFSFLSLGARHNADCVNSAWPSA